jgi:hypothetical protein
MNDNLDRILVGYNVRISRRIFAEIMMLFTLQDDGCLVGLAVCPNRWAKAPLAEWSTFRLRAPTRDHDLVT